MSIEDGYYARGYVYRNAGRVSGSVSVDKLRFPAEQQQRAITGPGREMTVGGRLAPRPAWWMQKRRKVVLLMAGILLFACFHLLASLGGSGGGLSPAERKQKGRPGHPGDGTAVVRGDARRLHELGNAKRWPPLPSPPRKPEGQAVMGRTNDRPKAGWLRPPVPVRPLVPGLPARETLGQFPWPIRQNFIPNYFLNYRNASSRQAPAGTQAVQFDSDSVLVYLHHNKAAGTTTKNCLRIIANVGVGRSVGNVMNSGGRLALEVGLFGGKAPSKMKSAPNTYYGGYSFGMCDGFTRPCAYFTVMREPYERTLSSYMYCKHARGDQLCSAHVANRVSLREWALHQGNFFFRQLLFQPQFCSDNSQWMRHISVDGVPHEFLPHHPESLEGAPCWFRQKLIMAQTLNDTQREALLQYCLDNLERWFAVIMIVEHYDESLQMAQEAFKLPMYKICAGKHANSRRKIEAVVDSNVTSQNRTRSAKLAEKDALLKAELGALRQDPEIQQVLRPDVLLYQKGVEIFNKQRLVFNEIKSQT